MGKYGSADFGVLIVDGYDFLAGKVKNFTYKITAGQENTTGLGDATDQMTPTGVEKLEVTQAGAYFDDSTNQAHALLASSDDTPETVSRLMAAAFGGNVIGRPFFGVSGLYAMAYSVVAKVIGLTLADVLYNISGSIDRGAILNESSTVRTANWNTKTDGHEVDYAADPRQQVIPITSATKASPCVVTTAIPHGLAAGHKVLISGNTLAGPSINAEAAVTVISATTFSVAVDTTGSTGAGTGGSFVRTNSLAGGAGYQGIPQMAGFTGFVGKIRDSADDTTYGDLLTFTNVTASPAMERRTDVADATVDRYLCYTGTVTGSGTIQAFVGFARS